jgi:hypothetical protein
MRITEIGVVTKLVTVTSRVVWYFLMAIDPVPLLHSAEKIVNRGESDACSVASSWADLSEHLLWLFVCLAVAKHHITITCPDPRESSQRLQQMMNCHKQDNVKQWLLKCKIQISTLPFIFPTIKGVGSVEKWRNNIGAGKISRWHCAPVGSKRVEQMKNAWNFPLILVLKGKNAYIFTIHLELLFKLLDANNDTHKSIGTISYLYSLMSILFIRNSCAFLFMWTKKKQVYIFELSIKISQPI